MFSPTVKNDEKWDWVKQQKLLVENLPLIHFLKQLKDKEKNQNKVVGDPPKADVLLGLVETKKGDDGKFDARIPESCFYHDYNEDTLKDLLHQQQQMVDLLKVHGKTKHLANRILFLFDDLVGSSLFSGARQNTFKMLNTNHRHLSVSLCMISQSFKEIPKTIRNQFSCLILFEIYNDSEIESIYEEFPMAMKKQLWHEAYRYCVDDEYGFMYYNIQKPKNLRVMKNFKQVLFVK